MGSDLCVSERCSSFLSRVMFDELASLIFSSLPPEILGFPSLGCGWLFVANQVGPEGRGSFSYFSGGAYDIAVIWLSSI